MRIRRQDNYFAIFDGRTTQRFTLDGKEFKHQQYPEILDISIGSKCLANCPFCYTSAVKTGIMYVNVPNKINELFGKLPENLRPFQVALGGEGEPTMHPELKEILKAFKDLNIVPNYTTNGMHVTDELLSITKEYCGGIAVSAHPHIEKIWRGATQRYLDAGILTCLHIIIGEPGSVDRYLQIRDEFPGIEYFVLLPYQVAGRADDIDCTREWEKLFALDFPTNTAFGALFYEYLKKANLQNIPIYEPEVLSGYVIMDDNYRILRTSSYDLRPKPYEPAHAIK